MENLPTSSPTFGPSGGGGSRDPKMGQYHGRSGSLNFVRAPWACTFVVFFLFSFDPFFFGSICPNYFYFAPTIKYQNCALPKKTEGFSQKRFNKYSRDQKYKHPQRIHGPSGCPGNLRWAKSWGGGNLNSVRAPWACTFVFCGMVFESTKFHGLIWKWFDSFERNPPKKTTKIKKNILKMPSSWNNYSCRTRSQFTLNFMGWAELAVVFFSPQKKLLFCL